MGKVFCCNMSTKATFMYNGFLLKIEIFYSHSERFDPYDFKYFVIKIKTA